jgi:hypothetical protein
MHLYCPQDAASTQADVMPAPCPSRVIPCYKAEVHHINHPEYLCFLSQVVPILRAGLVLLEQAQTVLPACETYHVGYVRNEETLEVSGTKCQPDRAPLMRLHTSSSNFLQQKEHCALSCSSSRGISQPLLKESGHGINPEIKFPPFCIATWLEYVSACVPYLVFGNGVHSSNGRACIFDSSKGLYNPN